MHYRCPICNVPLIRNKNGYTCQNKHHYDIAKQGYVNFVNNRKAICGDNKEMVQARSSFLHKGFYQPLRDRLCELLIQQAPHVLIDAGCGEGYYTNEFQRALPNCEIYGFDLSKTACKEGTRAHTNVKYAIASVHKMPIANHCADCCISVFAPIYIDEILRILKDHGIFMKVGPGPKHLWELKQLLYEEVYENKRKFIHHDQMTLIHREQVDTNAVLKDGSDIMTLFSMTPYAFRTPKDNIDRLKQIDELNVQLQFSIEVYQKAKD